MDATWSPSRRRFLLSQGGTLVLAAVAGCMDSGNDGRPEGDDSETQQPDTTVTDGSPDDRETADSDEGDLDLEEANVVDVSFESQNGVYTFDVTLHHDDGGEAGYANWWQVEQLDGTRLGRRDLLHAHSEQPFTRSETIEIPEDVTCVVVRGHDQTHEYGGLAMIVNLDSGETRTIDQGSDPGSFDESDCP